MAVSARAPFWRGACSGRMRSRAMSPCAVLRGHAYCHQTIAWMHVSLRHELVLGRRCSFAKQGLMVVCNGPGWWPAAKMSRVQVAFAASTNRPAVMPAVQGQRHVMRMGSARVRCCRMGALAGLRRCPVRLDASRGYVSLIPWHGCRPARHLSAQRSSTLSPIRRRAQRLRVKTSFQRTQAVRMPTSLVPKSIMSCASPNPERWWLVLPNRGALMWMSIC